MAKRIFIAVLAAVSVFALAACKEDKADNDVKTSDETVSQSVVGEGEFDYDAHLSNERYDGYNFRILVRKGYLPMQYLEEDSEEIVESAVYRRNKEIEAKYGIKITASESSSAGTGTDALNSILAGDDAYDLIFSHSRSAFTYAVQGAAYNINDISSINLSNPWWSQDIKNSCDINGHVYVLDGDFTTEGLASCMSIFFNKRIFDELGFDYPYETVRDGEWTFDEFAYYAKKGAADLDGDGVMTPEKDQYGFVSGEWEMPIGILYTGGQRIFGKNDDGELELTLYNNKTVEIYDEFFNLMDNEACFIAIEGQYSGGSHFSEGRAMMQAAIMGSAAGFRNMDDDFGIVPYPKFDDDDDYASIINGHASLGIIPITVSDVERTGAITEALCAYGSKYVIPAFYEVSLKTKSARDEDSEEMMDLIREKTVFDIGYLAGGSFNSTGRELARLPSHDFSSFYAERENKAKEQVKEFNQDYGHFE